MDRRAGIESAERLAAALRQHGAAGRADLRPVLSVLFFGSASWEERRARARRLLAQLSDTWLVRRSAATHARACRVSEVLGDYLRAPVSEPEARFVLGWCARILGCLEREAMVGLGSGRR